MNGSKRQQKYARLVQREIGDIFQKEGRKLLEGHFVTVTDVRISPDLGVARVYLSMMLVEDKEGLLEKINYRKSELRKMLGNRIGKQSRIIPELVLFIDDLEEKANQLDQLIDSLDIPPADEDE